MRPHPGYRRTIEALRDTKAFEQLLQCAGTLASADFRRMVAQALPVEQRADALAVTDGFAAKVAGYHDRETSVGGAAREEMVSDMRSLPDEIRGQVVAEGGRLPDEHGLCEGCDE